MQVSVLFFASLKEQVGEDELTLEVPEGAGLEALFEALDQRLDQGAMDALRAENVRVAVNQQLVGQAGAASGGPGASGTRLHLVAGSVLPLPAHVLFLDR